MADGRFPILDGTGARLTGARWNNPGRPLIYTAETFAGAMLEILVHSNLNRAPRNQVLVEIHIPESFSNEILPTSLDDWKGKAESVTREFGDRWLSEMRSLLLIVTSAVTTGVESNLLINEQFSRTLGSSR